MIDGNSPYIQKNDEIDLIQLLVAIWQGKWMVLSITAVFAVAGVIYAISLPNIYRSDVLLSPVAEDKGFNVGGQLGSLAALAGVNLSGNGGNKTGLALEILQSRDFISRFIEKYDLFLPVVAAEGWDMVDNTLVINQKIYDSSSKQWVREVSPPFSPKPSLLEAYREFSGFLEISQDSTTGMIELSVSHYSPALAQQWSEMLVSSINEEMRIRDLKEAQDSISYLNEQIENTKNTDVRTMLYSLIEEQSKTVMLANVRKEYVFKTIDPAIVAEEKVKPARALICVFAVMMGLGLSVLIVSIRYFVRRV